ncbi:MAG: RES family NAD+ phosphorylase [Gemmatimonadaceae bacterium]
MPPADLGRIVPPTTSVPAGTIIYRIHDLNVEPLWFGFHPDGPRNRFDDPAAEFGVCYFGLTREAAFAETFLRRPPVRMISRGHADRKAIASVQVLRPLLVVRLLGAGLPLLGTTAAVSSGPHAASRAWSRALWSDRRGRGAGVDGIQYRCRHDDDEIALAVYDRAAEALEVATSIGVRADRSWFGSVLDRYGLALVD